MPDITIDTLSIEIDKKGQPSSDALKNLKDRLVVLKDLSDSVARLGGQGVQGLDAFAKAIGNIQSAIDKLDSSKLQNLKITAQKTSSGEKKSRSRSTLAEAVNTANVEEELKTRADQVGYSASESLKDSSLTKNSDGIAKAFDATTKYQSLFTNVQQKIATTSDDINARISRMVDNANKKLMDFGVTSNGKLPIMQEYIEQTRESIRLLADDYQHMLQSTAGLYSNTFSEMIQSGKENGQTGEDYQAIRGHISQLTNEFQNLASVELSALSTKIKELETNLIHMGDTAREVIETFQEMEDIGSKNRSLTDSFLPSSGEVEAEKGFLWNQRYTKFDFGWYKSLDSSKIKDVDEWLQKASESAKKFASALGKVGANIGKAVWKKATSGIKDFASKLDHVRKRFTQLLLTRTLRKIMTEFANALKEGTTNLYQWSKALGGEFARSMDQASASTLYLKNSFGAMVAPIVNALVPALDAIINSIVGVMNAFNQLFALLGGQTYWTKAIKQQKDYAKATGGSTKANKDYLLSIDELNVLNDDKGGGGGGSAMDYSNMFEDVTVFDDWAKKIQDAVENGDWYGVGEIIGKKLNEIILDLDTAQWGSNLAEKINHALDASLGLFETIDTKLWGGKVSAFFNKIFEEVNFDTAGEVLATKTNKLWEFFLGIVRTFKWDVASEALQTGINSWIGKIDPSTITQTFNTTWQGIMKVIQGIASSNWGDLGKKVGQAINEIEWSKDINATIDAVFALADSIEDFLAGAITEIEWDKLTEGLLDGIKTVVDELPDKIVESLGNSSVVLGEVFQQIILGAIAWAVEQMGFEGLAEKIRGFSDQISEEFSKPLIDKGDELRKQTETDYTEFASQFEGNTDELVRQLVGDADAVSKDASDTSAEITQKAKETVGEIDKKFSELKSKTYVKDYNEADAKPQFGEIVKEAEKTNTDVHTFLEPLSKMDYIKVWQKDDVSKYLEQAVKDSQTGYTNITTALADIKNMTLFGEWKKKDIDPVFGDLTYDKMKSKGESIASGISAGLKSITLPTVEVTTVFQDVKVGKNTQSVGTPKFSWRAGGGFPDQGEMFIARENGAEMVGRIGNKTAVANNDQIVDAIAYGVYQAVTEAGGMGGGAQTINVVAELDGQKMYESNKTVGRDRGYDLGMGAFGYVNNI